MATLRGWAIGLAIAMVAGIVLGLVIGSIPVAAGPRPPRRSSSCGPIPSVALIPLAVLLYGTDMQATLLLVVYASFWQVLCRCCTASRTSTRSPGRRRKSYRFRPLPRVRT